MQTRLRACGTALLLIWMIALNGCATRVITIDKNVDVMRTGETVKMRVYLMDKNGDWVKQGKAVIPEGTYLTPGPKE